MKRLTCLGLILAGLGAGAVNGLLGAGGGMVLVPLMTLLTDTPQDEIFSSSLAIILPICLVSLFLTAGIAWQEALPYLVGSGLGGAAAGIWGKKIPVLWLHRALGILIIYGGLRYLW